MEQGSDTFDGFCRSIDRHTFQFVGLDLAPRLRQFRFGFRQFFFLLPPLLVNGVIVCLRGFPLHLQSGNVYRQRFLLSF